MSNLIPNQNYNFGTGINQLNYLTLTTLNVSGQTILSGPVLISGLLNVSNQAVFSENVFMLKNLTVSQNVNAAFFIGDGGYLTNINTTFGILTVNSITINDNIISSNLSINSAALTINGTTLNINSNVNILGTANLQSLNVASNITASYYIGNANLQNLFVSGTANLQTLNVVDNVAASYFIGNGSLLTNINSTFSTLNVNSITVNNSINSNTLTINSNSLTITGQTNFENDVIIQGEVITANSFSKWDMIEQYQFLYPIAYIPTYVKTEESDVSSGNYLDLYVENNITPITFANDINNMTIYNLCTVNIDLGNQTLPLNRLIVLSNDGFSYPTEVLVYGSNSATDFNNVHPWISTGGTLITTQSLTTSPNEQTLDFTNSVPYRYYNLLYRKPFSLVYPNVVITRVKLYNNDLAISKIYPNVSDAWVGVNCIPSQQFEVNGNSQIDGELIVNGSVNGITWKSRDGGANKFIMYETGTTGNELLGLAKYGVGYVYQVDYATGGMAFYSNVNISGITNLSSSLLVSGATNLFSTLTVAGATTISNTVDIKGGSGQIILHNNVNDSYRKFSMYNTGASGSETLTIDNYGVGTILRLQYNGNLLTGNIGVNTLSLEPNTAITVASTTNNNILLDGWQTDKRAGVYFRPGYVSSNYYNCSIFNYDPSGGSTPDGISINGYSAVSICTGSNGRNQQLVVLSTGKCGLGSTPNSTCVSKMVVGDPSINGYGGSSVAAQNICPRVLSIKVYQATPWTGIVYQNTLSPVQSCTYTSAGVLEIVVLSGASAYGQGLYVPNIYCLWYHSVIDGGGGPTTIQMTNVNDTGTTCTFTYNVSRAGTGLVNCEASIRIEYYGEVSTA